MDGYQAAVSLLPGAVRRDAERLTAGDRRRCEELRLRTGRPASALIAGRETVFGGEPVTGEQLRWVLEAATRSSLHAAENQLRRGFVTAPGGVRIGVCGAGVEEGDDLLGLRSFTSLAVRVPREVTGCADGIWDRVTAGGFRSLLVISPPGAGKTTLLRELIRRLSESGLRVGVADERGELSGGSAGFDLGPCTDVLTGVAKAAAAEMLIRTMSPQVVAMDEIADAREGAALLSAAGCGAELLASVHGESAADARGRTACRRLLAAGVFRRCVTVSCRGGQRRYRVEELG